jgi:hypothetical protein
MAALLAPFLIASLRTPAGRVNVSDASHRKNVDVLSMM